MTFSNVALTLISLVIALGVEHLLQHVSLQLSEADAKGSALVVELNAIDATIPVSLMAVVQLFGAWFLFQWWRDA